MAGHVTELRSNARPVPGVSLHGRGKRVEQARVVNSRSTRLARRLGLSLILSLTAIAAAIAPAQAQAVPDLNAAIRTANAVFPAVAQRCGNVGIEVGALSALNAAASAESYFFSCRVRIAPGTLTTASNAQLCSLMVHEWGHLAGLEHSADAGHFMNARVPHNRACGASDEELRARQAVEVGRTLRREEIGEALAELRGALRATHRARRRARGAKRARLARKAKKLEKRIVRLRGDLRSL